MTYRTALLASLMVVVVSPCGAQAPASGSTAQSAASSATPATPAAPVSPAAPADQPAPASPTAQAAPASPATPTLATAPAPAAAPASSEPSPELLKQARSEGFRPKKRDGVTVFCHTDATLGTRFETEKCVSQIQLQSVIEQREDARNVLRQQNACAGCSGH